ncbi:DUF1649-domain-containing protein [Xylariaceae sp. FL0804]|nr:DUF1649-domain-containing protein [Xylariaceae sp. FL0804]
MEQQNPQEFILEAFTDPASVRDVVRGILHTIFFHRFFPSAAPRSRDVLDITLPYVGDAELDTMIERQTAELARELEDGSNNNNSRNSGGGAGGGPASTATGSGAGGGAGGPSTYYSSSSAATTTAATTAHHHSNSRGGGRATVAVQFFEKRRRKAWYMRAAADDEVCWECWTVRVTVAEPRTDSERAKVRRAMEQTLLTAAMKIVTCVNTHKDHIPPITTSDTNPFPYQINVNSKGAGAGAGSGWATRMGIY